MRRTPTFAEFMRSVRERTATKQVALATTISQPQSYVSKYENAERSISVEEFIDICNALKLSPSEILDEFIKSKDVP